MKVVVIGGGAAGMTAASRIKALQPSWDVKVFEKTNFVSHAPCGIPFYISDTVRNLEDLCTYTPEYFKVERGIDVHTNARVIEVEEGYITVEENGRDRVYEWDKLLFATGSKALKFDFEDFDGVFYINGFEELELLKRRVLKAENIVVIGLGFIGVEIVDAIINLKKKPIVIEMKDRPLPEFDKEISAILKPEIERYSNLRLNERVVGFEGKDKLERVITNRAEYKCDLAIVAIGLEPNTDIAKGFVELGVKNAIKTNSKMQTSVENVYAAGDCAETKNLITGKQDWIPLAVPANKTGYIAGVNISGFEMHYPGSIKSILTSFHGIEIGKVGLSETEAIEMGYDVVSSFITAKSSARYLPNDLIHLKMVAERNGRILGVQAIGNGVTMRIYAASVMLYKGFNVVDAFLTELPYYPKFSRVWDPIVVSARRIFRKLNMP